MGAWIERSLCPPLARRVTLSTPLPPTEAARALTRHRVRNVWNDLTTKGRLTDPGDLRISGRVGPHTFDISQAGRANEIRTVGRVVLGPSGSRIHLRFRLERRQLLWDALLFLILVFVAARGGTSSRQAATLALAAAVVLLWLLRFWIRRRNARIEALHMIAFIAESVEGQMIDDDQTARDR